MLPLPLRTDTSYPPRSLSFTLSLSLFLLLLPVRLRQASLHGSYQRTASGLGADRRYQSCDHLLLCCWSDTYTGWVRDREDEIEKCRSFVCCKEGVA